MVRIDLFYQVVNHISHDGAHRRMRGRLLWPGSPSPRGFTTNRHLRLCMPGRLRLCASTYHSRSSRSSFGGTGGGSMISRLGSTQDWNAIGWFYKGKLSKATVADNYKECRTFLYGVHNP